MHTRRRRDDCRCGLLEEEEFSSFLDITRGLRRSIGGGRGTALKQLLKVLNSNVSRGPKCHRAEEDSSIVLSCTEHDLWHVMNVIEPRNWLNISHFWSQRGLTALYVTSNSRRTLVDSAVNARISLKMSCPFFLLLLLILFQQFLVSVESKIACSFFSVSLSCFLSCRPAPPVSSPLHVPVLASYEDSVQLEFCVKSWTALSASRLGHFFRSASSLRSCYAHSQV